MRRLPTSIAALAVSFVVACIFTVPVFSVTTVDDVSQGLTCQCGCGLTVANCNMPSCGFSVPMRAEIGRMIDKGMDRPAIIAMYRAKYGEKILSAPTTEGFNLLAWVMPFLALFVGGGFIVMVLGRWRHTSPSPAASAESKAARDIEIDPRLREKLAAEVKEQL